MLKRISRTLSIDINDNFPYFTTIKVMGSNSLFEFFYNYAPTNNCQLSCFSQGENIIHMQEEDIKQTLSYLNTRGILKNIVMLDVRQSYYEEVKRKITPFCKKIVSRTYRSSNSSNMCIMLCYLKIDEI